MKVNTSKSFYKWEVVLLLWIAFFLNQADRQAFNIVLPQIQDHLGASDSTMGLIAMLFNLFYAVTVPFAGFLADRMSRSRQIWVSTLIFSTATLFTGLSGGIFSFIMFRCLGMGIGQGMFGPTYTGIIAEYHDTRTRARAMSLHQTSYYIGVITCGFLAGWVAEKLGWQYAFYIFGGAGILFTAVLAMRLKDKPRQQAPALAVGNGGTGAGDNGGTATGEEVKPTLFRAIAAIFKVPTAVCMLVAYIGLIFGLNGYLTWMPKYLKETFGLSLTAAGFHSMFWTHAAAFVGVLVAGALSDRMAARPSGARNRLLLQAAGLLLASPCIVLMGMSGSFGTVCAALAGFGFFRAFFDAGTYAVLYDVIEPKYYSLSSAVLILFGFGIGSLAPWILGMISDAFGLSGGIASLGAVWAVASVALLIARTAFFDKDAKKIAK
ncbi:MAG: MFS transporter [Bacteroidales bacterium]|nr:MFS transporter [Bacteroidales bacterium]